MEMKKDERIKVAVRCRPLMKYEKDKNEQKYNKYFNSKRIVFVDVDRGEICVKKLSDPNEAPRNFYFDNVYDET